MADGEFDAISGPETEPSTQPDDLSQREILQLRGAARQAYDVEQRLCELKDHRDKLAAEVQQLRATNDQIVPRNAELEQARRNCTSNTNQSTLAMAFGGALVSLAPVFGGAAMYTALGFGGASIIWGAVLLLRTNRLWPPT